MAVRREIPGGAATMGTSVCETCGASNPVGTSFCQGCRAFVGWDQTSVLAGGTPADQGSGQGADLGSDLGAEQNIETRLVPKIKAGPVADAPPRLPPVAPVLAVRLDRAVVTVPTTGERVELPLMITNRSDIVDGYEVDVGVAPDWLRVDSQPLRLLPGNEDGLVLGLRIDTDHLVPAGRGTVQLRVRSLTQVPAHEVLTVTVEVPVVDAPVRLRSEPSVVRVADLDVGRFVVVVDNTLANRPADVSLVGSDPELAVSFHFDPAHVVVAPGQSARVRVVTTSPRPRPGAEVSRTLTLTAIDGRRTVDTTVTLLQSTSAVIEDPPVELAAGPSLLRIRDGEPGTVRLRIDNRGARQGTSLRLTSEDAEQVVTARWNTTEVHVPSGGSIEAEVRLSSPVPDAGTETRHPITLSASDGRRVVRTQVTLVHTSSASPMSTLTAQLDPSVLRLGPRRRGSTTVVVDNRRGRRPVRLGLRGDDPENALGFVITPRELTVGPGQVQTARVAVTAPRAAGGRETSRSMTVSASDGRTAITTIGTVLQTPGDRRPWARVMLTLLGALAMIIGTMLPLRAASRRTAFAVDANAVAGLFDASVDLGGLERQASFALVIMVLAGLMVFGLTGRSGRLSRLAALLAAALTVGLLITIATAGLSGAPGIGAVAILLGAALGYVGGLLARR